jgi:hypothetical protein
LKYGRTLRTDQNLDIDDGDYRLVCMLANPTAEDLAYGSSIPGEAATRKEQFAQLTAAERASAQAETERLLRAAGEPYKEWYARHWLLITLMSGTIFTGLTAVLIQRTIKNKGDNK